MGSIPFPNIAALGGEIAAAPQQQYGQAVAIRGEQQRQQAMAQDMEIKRRQLADQDALTKTLSQYDPTKNTLADIPKMMAQNGGSGAAALKTQQGLVEARSNLLKLSDEQFAQQQKQNDLIQGVHDSVSGAATPEEKQVKYTEGLQSLQQAGVDVSKESPQYPGDQAFAQHLPAIRLHSALLADAGKQREMQLQQSEIGANQAKATGERYKEVNGALMDLQAEGGPKPVNTSALSPQDWGNLVDSVIPASMDKQANAGTHAQVNFALKQGNIKGAQDAITKAGEQAGAISKATNPAIQAAELHLATMKKAAEQAITDGDPKAAAQLLINGTVAPSQLVSSRKPAFAQQAFTAAAQMQPGWSATKADADYKVASSPTNVAFFGSAKSLTDKGGTLDQLAAAGDDIPGHRIPVFNTIDDAMRAATGSGPVAKYASILVGVADDYSKVMGGGQGSDTSRSQALKLVPANASPEARKAAMEGIRGAVGSQIRSRVGNNTVLQKMYGVDSSSPSAPSAPDPFAAFGGKAR